jgi:hypothetical protein
MVGEWRGHGEKGRDLGKRLKEGIIKSDHERLKTQTRGSSMDSIGRQIRAQLCAVERSTPQRAGVTSRAN